MINGVPDLYGNIGNPQMCPTLDEVIIDLFRMRDSVPSVAAFVHGLRRKQWRLELWSEFHWISMNLACAGFSMACKQRRSESGIDQLLPLSGSHYTTNMPGLFGPKIRFCVLFVFILEVGPYALPAWSVVVGLVRSIWEKRETHQKRRVSRKQRTCEVLAAQLLKAQEMNAFREAPEMNTSGCQQLHFLPRFCRWLFALCQSSWVHRCWTKAGSIPLISLASGHSSSPCSPWWMSSFCGATTGAYRTPSPRTRLDGWTIWSRSEDAGTVIAPKKSFK